MISILPRFSFWFTLFLESNNLKFVKKFSSPQEPIPVKNINKMLLPTNLVKPVTLRLHWSIAYLLWQKFQKEVEGGELIQKTFLFLSFNLSYRHWMLLFFSISNKHTVHTGQHIYADFSNKASQILPKYHSWEDLWLLKREFTIGKM